MTSSTTPAHPLWQRLKRYARLTRFDRPIGTLLLLWPTLWALWAAATASGLPWPPLPVVLVFVAGTVLMRAAGCAINDYFDRDIDRHVERTRERVLTSGQISPKEALAVAAALALVAFLLVLTLNPLTIGLAFAALLLATTYPLMKRFFAVPQLYLGVAFGFGIPMAFAALQNTVPTVAWLMLAANVAWTLAYDTEYAMVDRNDDLRLGLHSSAISFGRWDVLAVALSYAVCLVLLALCGRMLGYGTPYWATLAVAGALAARHLAWIRGRDRLACFRAFLDNTWIGMVVFVGIVVQTTFWPKFQHYF